MNPRWRLMRRRLRHRLRRSLGIAFVCGTLLFLVRWSGYRGKFGPFTPARNLAEIWWQLPLFVALFFLLMLLWPWRFDRHDSI